MKEHLQSVSFEIIDDVNNIKKKYTEAISLSKKNKFEEAYAHVVEADKLYVTAHKHHFEFAQKEAQGDDIPYSLIFMHAEDQLLSAEILKLMTLENIELREELYKIKKIIKNK